MQVDEKMIPPEVVEAAARAAYETPIPGASSWGEKPWEEVDGMLREYFVWQASAAIAAALKVWPGVTRISQSGGGLSQEPVKDGCLILPPACGGQRMSEWQPIETAPRDGTLIRVGWKFPNDTEMQEWFTMQWGHIQKNPIFAPDAVGMWVMPDGSLTWYEDPEAGPTHWMPIPTGDA